MNTRLTTLFLVLCTVETALMTAAHNCAGAYISPLLLLCASLLVGWLPLRYARASADGSGVPTSPPRRWRDGLVCGFLFLAGTVTSTNLVRGNLRTTPIRADISDVVPQIQHLTGRWLRGEFPYQPIDFGHPYEFFPVYLPAHWMPFAVFEQWGIDYRLGATWLLWAALLVPLSGMVRAAVPLWHKALWTVLTFVLFDFFVLSGGFMFAIAVEQLIMGYYVLLVVSLADRRNVWLTAGAALLCLLSRFALLFWLPIFLGALWLDGRRREALGAAGVLTLGVLLLYVLPFMVPEPALFWKAQKTYLSATLIEWNLGASRPHLFGGRGLACYFVDLQHLNMATRIQWLQVTAVAASLLAALGLLWHCWRQRSAFYFPAFAAGSLKIMLSVFYAFVQIPYDYLYLVPAGATVGLMYLVLKK